LDSGLARLYDALSFIRETVGVDVPIQQVLILLLVGERKSDNPITMPEVGLKLQMTQGSVSRNIRMLSRFADTAKGTFRGYDLISAAPDLFERRRLALRLTPKGEEVIKGLEKEMSIR